MLLLPKAVVGNAQSTVNSRPLVYSVEFTDPPCLQPRTKVGEQSVIQRFGRSNAIVIGSHTDTKATTDSLLTLDIITRLFTSLKGSKRKIAIGLSVIPSTIANAKLLAELSNTDGNVCIDSNIHFFP